MSSNHLNRHVMICERKCHVDVVSLEEMTRRELRFRNFEKLTRITNCYFTINIKACCSEVLMSNSRENSMLYRKNGKINGRDIFIRDGDK